MSLLIEVNGDMWPRIEGFFISGSLLPSDSFIDSFINQSAILVFSQNPSLWS